MKPKIKKENKSLTIIRDNSPAEMIRMAVAGKADLDKLEKLLSLQERYEANEARKAYHMAMAAFKANPPKIDKDKRVSFATSVGKTTYNHASLANVTEKISAELSKHGLSASWATKQNGAVSVTCKITHIKGHSEETTLSASADTSGSKNAIQAIGSTITYLERYTLLALTGLATYDQDDDGRTAGGKPEVARPEAIIDKSKELEKPIVRLSTEAQQKAIHTLATKIYAKDQEKFINRIGRDYGVEHTKELTLPQASNLIETLSKELNNGK